MLHADEIIGAPAEKTETVKTYNTEFIFRGFIRKPFLNITLRHYTPKDEKNNSEIIRYEPNTLANWGASFSWQGFGFAFGLDSPKSEKDESQYGNTKYYDFQVYFYWQRFGFDAHYQKYQGFFLFNPEKYGYSAGSPEALRPDIKATSIGCNVFWSFFEEFSFSAAFDQSQRQLSTAFSPLLMASFNTFSIASDHSIIPPSQEGYYGKFSGYTGGDYTGIAITPGFAITYVWNQNWYASAAGFLGSGWMHKNYSTALGNTTENKPFGKGNLRASFGYNDDDLFAGIQGSWDFTASERTFRRNLNEEMTEVIAVTADISIFFGKRF
jgi:hypothetical protein